MGWRHLEDWSIWFPFICSSASVKYRLPVSPNGFRLMFVLCPSTLFFLWCLKVASGISYSSATALQLMPGSIISSLTRTFSKSAEEYVYGLFLLFVPTGLTMMKCLTQWSRHLMQYWVLFEYAVYALKPRHGSVLGLVWFLYDKYNWSKADSQLNTGSCLIMRHWWNII